MRVESCRRAWDTGLERNITEKALSDQPSALSQKPESTGELRGKNWEVKERNSQGVEAAEAHHES